MNSDAIRTATQGHGEYRAPHRPFGFKKNVVENSLLLIKVSLT